MNLFGIDKVSEMDRSAVARRSLNNLLTSYADEADVFTEVIQNAFDAISLAAIDDLYTDEVQPKIDVVIGRRNSGHHYLYVADNGIGMDSEVAKNLTVPGYSYGKSKGKTVGYKGVGASYFFAASQKAALKTVDQTGAVTEYTVRGSYEWVKNIEEPDPNVEDKCDVPPFVKDLLPTSRGTGLLFQFHEGMKPKDLNGIVIIGKGPDAELKSWLSFLASKTAIGSVNDISGLKITINIFLDLGEDQHSQSWRIGEFDPDSNIIGYPFPNKVFRVSKCTDEIDKTPVNKMVQHTRRHQAVHKRWTTDELAENMQNLSEEELGKLREYLEWVEGYFCYSTDVLKEVNNRLGGRNKLVRHGMKIVCDGIPQGRNIDLSLTSSQGLDRQTHIVLAFKGLELDTGRKISADEIIASAVTKIGQKVVSILKEYRWAMKVKDRPDVTSDLDTWSSAIDARSKTSLVRELYSSHNLPPVFSVDPDSENEVIGLFVSLLAVDLLKGYTVKAISGYARYDSLTKVDSVSSNVKDLEDILSVRNDDSGVNGDYKVLEFKFNFESLLEDFTTKKKNPAEVDICVCWTVPTLNVSRGRLEPCYGQWKDHRPLYGASYIWIDENDTSTIPIISLENVLAELLARHESKKAEPGLGQGTLQTLEQADKAAAV